MRGDIGTPKSLHGMSKKNKIAIGLCLFLTLTPFIGACISADTTVGEYIGNFTPYIHLTMPQLDGLPFAGAFGGLIAICIFLVGLVGLIVFVMTKFRKAGWLLFLLYMTTLYCGLRAIGGLIFNMVAINQLDMKARIIFVAAIISDIVWGLFCIWATRILSNKSQTINTNDDDTKVYQ